MHRVGSLRTVSSHRTVGSLRTVGRLGPVISLRTVCSIRKVGSLMTVDSHRKVGSLRTADSQRGRSRKTSQKTTRMTAWRWRRPARPKDSKEKSREPSR